MPTYEYRCEKCGEQFDVFQSFTARPLRRHEACGGPVEKVFHPRGVTFKGSGFYANDSRPKNGSDSSSKGESSESKPAKSESSKSESSKSESSKSESSKSESSKSESSKSESSKSESSESSGSKQEARSS